MQLSDVMRTTFAAREYTDETISDATLYRILEQARFAPSGGNRQGWRVVIVKDTAIRTAMKQLMQPAIKQYLAQSMAGEVPFNTIKESSVDDETIANMPARFPLVDQLESAPALLVISVDLSQVTSFDRDLSRVGVISGASIYPFVWNILLAARNEGLGGVLTTFLAHGEEAAKALLKLPPSFAVASMVALGKPVKQLTRLKRSPVETFARVDSWQGEAFTGH
jgi:nitroreductase|tara:strand:+ start:4571 stop:5239 length:669 start_codon:yes stop_codon:yes gene_type:complete